MSTMTQPTSSPARRPCSAEHRAYQTLLATSSNALDPHDVEKSYTASYEAASASSTPNVTLMS